MKTKTHPITKSGSAYSSKWCKSDCNDKFDKCVSDNSDDKDAINKCFKMGNICLSKCKGEAASDYTPYHSAYKPSYDDCMKQCYKSSDDNYDMCAVHCSYY